MSPKCGPSGFRPLVGLRPNTPQHAAGIRMEPPASFPWAMATMPEATAAPAPPLEPPGVRVVSHGLRVGPNLTGSVVAPIAISGRLVLPMAISPARFQRLTSSASSSGTKSPMKFDDSVKRTPAYSARKSLTRNGTPENGPFGNGPSRRLASLVVHRRDDGVEGGIEPLDALDRGLHELRRRHVAVADHLRLGRGVDEAQSRRSSTLSISPGASLVALIAEQRSADFTWVTPNLFATSYRIEFRSPAVRCVEPTDGFEPSTCGLRNRCSTTELRWLDQSVDWFAGNSSYRLSGGSQP